MNVSCWPEPAREGYGQSTAALPATSDVDFLGDLKRVVDLNTEREPPERIILVVRAEDAGWRVKTLGRGGRSAARECVPLSGF